MSQARKVAVVAAMILTTIALAGLAVGCGEQPVTVTARVIAVESVYIELNGPGYNHYKAFTTAGDFLLGRDARQTALMARQVQEGHTYQFNVVQSWRYGGNYAISAEEVAK